MEAAALRDIRRQLKRHRQNEHQFRKRRDSNTGLTAWTLQTAMCIACISNWDFVLAAAWVDAHRRRGASAVQLEDDFSTIDRLENFFLNADENEVVAWVDPSVGEHVQASVIRTATQWVAGRRAAVWVQDLNQRIGMAVRSADVIDSFNSEMTRLNHDVVEVEPVAEVTMPAGRMWMNRWRRKHNGSVGRIRAADILTLEEKRSKVATPNYVCYFKFLVPFLGVVFWDPFLIRFQ